MTGESVTGRSELVTGSGEQGRRRGGSPLGLHRVIEPAGVLPQAAWRLEADPAIWPDEVRVREIGRASCRERV